MDNVQGSEGPGGPNQNDTIGFGPSTEGVGTPVVEEGFPESFEHYVLFIQHFLIF